MSEEGSCCCPSLCSEDTEETQESTSAATKAARPTKGKAIPARSQRNVHVKCPERCIVCRDQSTGYHYGVPTCNRCKVFFRRYVLNEKEYTCARDGNCFEQLTKRQFLLCRACRYERCLEVGMSPLGIVAPGVDLTGNYLIKRYLARRKHEEMAKNPDTLSLPTLEDTVDGMVNDLLYVEKHHDAVRRSIYCVRSNSDVDLEFLIATPSSLGMNFPEMSGWPLPDVDSGDDLDHPMIYYVTNRVPFPPVQYETKADNDKQWVYVDLIYTVDYVKTFTVFKKLKYMDQISLLKHITVAATFITQTFFTHEQNSRYLIFPDGRTPFRKHEMTSKKEMATAVPLMKKMKLDRIQYALIKAIITWDPCGEDLSAEGRQIINKEREKYASALMAYLLTNHGAKRAPTVYVQCLAIIEKIHEQVNNIRNLDTLLLALEIKSRSKLGQQVNSIC